MTAGKGSNGNGGRAPRPVVAVDPMANEFAAAVEAIAARLVALSHDSLQLDRLSFASCTTALVLPGRLMLGRPGHGTTAGGTR
jgi:hypothetical protein